MADNVDLVADLIQGAFNDPELISSLLGNIQHETGGSYDYLQQQFGGGPGRGLIQMEGGMLDAYQKYLKDNKLENSAQLQVGFIQNVLGSDELYDIGAGNRKKIQKVVETGTLDETTKAISDLFLRPGKPQIDKRLKNANEWYSTLTNNAR